MRALSKRRPGFPGRFRVDRELAETRPRLRGGLVGRAIDHLRSLGAGGNRNVAGLLGLGDLADEIDPAHAALTPPTPPPPHLRTPPAPPAPAPPAAPLQH